MIICSIIAMIMQVAILFLTDTNYNSDNEYENAKSNAILVILLLLVNVPIMGVAVSDNAKAPYAIVLISFIFCSIIDKMYEEIKGKLGTIEFYKKENEKLQEQIKQLKNKNDD